MNSIFLEVPNISKILIAKANNQIHSNRQGQKSNLIIQIHQIVHGNLTIHNIENTIESLRQH
jgi:adenylate kinase family enzyme